MAYEPKITRHDETGDVPMTLVERSELDALRAALREIEAGELDGETVEQFAERARITAWRAIQCHTAH